MTERLTAEAWRAQQRPRRRHKFGAKACVVDGVKFPSRREARRYQQLRLLERAGEIGHLELQPAYPLHAHGGHQVAKYVADFRYVVVSTGEVVVEDAKGVKTPIYRLKARWLKAEYGIEVREV